MEKKSREAGSKEKDRGQADSRKAKRELIRFSVGWGES